MVAANIIREIEDKALQMRELIVTDLIGMPARTLPSRIEVRPSQPRK